MRGTKQMDQSFGLALKRLRQSKNIEAKALAGEHISYPQLLKFEAGKSMISVDKLFFLLDSINISAEEYERTRSEIALLHHENIFFNRQVGQAFWNKNTSKLEYLLKEAIEKQSKHLENQRYQLNVIDIKAALHRLNPNYQISKNEIQFLVNYLSGIKEWSFYEAWLFSNTTEIFSDVQARALVNQMIYPKHQNIVSKRTQQEINLALLNTISHFIETEHFSPVQGWLNYLETHISSDLNLYDRAGLEYHSALLQFCETPQNPERLEKVQRCIAAFETLGCFKLADIMKNEVEIYKNKYHI